MKSTRGLPRPWLRTLPRERRSAMMALMLLVGILGSLMVYQRFLTGARPPLTPPPATSGASPVGPPVTQASPEGSIESSLPERDAQAVAVTPTRIGRPLAGAAEVIKDFSFSYSALFEDFRTHSGLDYAAQKGESVLAAAPGVVASIESDPMFGLAMILDHGGGLQTYYAGLSDVVLPKGAQVKARQVLAVVGEPGPAEAGTPSHLHFEVRQGTETVDPMPWFVGN